jgi:hypothetical protein
MKRVWANAVHPQNGTPAVANGFYRVEGCKLKQLNVTCRTHYEALLHTLLALGDRAIDKTVTLQILVCNTAILKNQDVLSRLASSGSTIEWLKKEELERHLLLRSSFKQSSIKRYKKLGYAA